MSVSALLYARRLFPAGRVQKPHGEGRVPRRACNAIQAFSNMLPQRLTSADSRRGLFRQKGLTPPGQPAGKRLCLYSSSLPGGIFHTRILPQKRIIEVWFEDATPYRQCSKTGSSFYPKDSVENEGYSKHQS